MVQILPGADAFLAPALTSLVQSIGQMYDPGYAMREALKKQVAINPALAQQLTDMLRNNPAMGAQLGLGQFGNTLAAGPESTGQMVDNAMRPAMQTALADPTNTMFRANTAVAGTTPGGITSDQFKQLTAQAGINYAQKNPQETESIAATGKSQAGNAIERSTAAEAGIQTAISQEAEGFFERNKNLDPREIVDGIFNGRFSGKDISAVLASPRGRMLAPFLSERAARQEESMRIRLMNASNAADMVQGVDKLKQAQAFRFFESVDAGSYDAAMSYLFDPAAKKKAEQLRAAGTKPAAGPDADLLAIHEGVQRLRQNGVDGEVRKQSQLINGLLTGVAKAEVAGVSDEELTIMTAQVNTALQAQNALTGRQVTVQFGEMPRKYAWQNAISPIMRKNVGLHFTDANGDFVKPETVLTEISSSSTQTATQAPAPALTVESARTALQSMRRRDGETATAFAKRQNDARASLRTTAPEIAKQLESGNR